MGKLNLRLMYPKSDEYEYETRLEKINLDKERESDILNNKGFIVSKYQGVKKDMKNPFSIFSSKFGQTLKDLNPFANRYKCQCGHTMSRINHNTKCKVCGKRVRYVDDDFEYFGWIVLQNYYIIHPNIYKSIAYFIGKDLKDILEFKKITDIDGHIHNVEIPEGKSPYYGIGMIEFKEKFEEIMEYYKKKNPGKIEYYEDIMLNKDKVFIQSIPVYTTHLRPFNADQTSFYYENANAKYMIMNKLVSDINLNDNRMDNTIKPKDQKLYDLQLKYNDLYKSIEDTLSTKRGNIRTLFGGRYNFSSRDVIVPNPELRIDQVTLPYAALVNLLQQSIINILHKMYNMSYSDAYTYWYKATINKNETVVNIIKSIINNKPRGLELIINRNPKIVGCIIER